MKTIIVNSKTNSVRVRNFSNPESFEKSLEQTNKKNISDAEMDHLHQERMTAYSKWQGLLKDLDKAKIKVESLQKQRDVAKVAFDKARSAHIAADLEAYGRKRTEI